METGNLLDNRPPAGPEEAFQTLVAVPGLRIERIVSHGHALPEGFWYDQAEDEWVVVLQGCAWLRFEAAGQLLEMTPGTWAWIQAHKRHRVEWTDPSQPTIWLAVYVPATNA